MRFCRISRNPDSIFVYQYYFCKNIVRIQKILCIDFNVLGKLIAETRRFEAVVNCDWLIAVHPAGGGAL